MIKLTRLNNTMLILNSDLIEMIEETPDTVITLTNGHKMVVREAAQEIIRLVVSYKRLLNQDVKEDGGLV